MSFSDNQLRARQNGEVRRHRVLRDFDKTRQFAGGHPFRLAGDEQTECLEPCRLGEVRYRYERCYASGPRGNLYQMPEAGVRQLAVWGSTDEGRHILIAVARYPAAHSPTERATLLTADTARRPMRGASCTREQGRRDARTTLMSSVAFISAANRGGSAAPRLGWRLARELLIVGATLDAANELAREIAKRKGAALLALRCVAMRWPASSPICRRAWSAWRLRTGRTIGLACSRSLAIRCGWISPQFVTPYVKSNKNDRNDAEAICEAVGRPSMRFVPRKSTDQLAVQAVHRIRRRLVANRVRLVNQICGLLSEHGIVIARDIAQLRRGVAFIAGNVNDGLSEMVRALMKELQAELTELDARIAAYDRRIIP